MKLRLAVLITIAALGFVCFDALSFRGTRAANPDPVTSTANHIRSTSRSGGLKEVIDLKYKKRYESWKKEFVSTEIGRAQWELYTRHPHLTLTITVAENNKNGAGTGLYKWNDAGELVEATIFLGRRIDEGYPSSIYYPVMNALEPYESTQLLSRNVLAATKIAHEFGHVMKIADTPASLYRLQVKLVPIYNKIFLSNGYNVNDPQLVELAQQMGGNPVEIWEDREYWGEANAMLYLRDRVAKENFHCNLFNRIKRTVEQYAKPTKSVSLRLPRRRVWFIHATGSNLHASRNQKRARVQNMQRQIFKQAIDEAIAEFAMLKHPFYQSWQEGKLDQPTLREYAKEYYAHVSAFPTYVSAVHSRCDNLQIRQLLLENLMEEERGPENHPELWLRFAEGLGTSRDEVRSTSWLPSTTASVEKFKALTMNPDFRAGLAALYAYESQIPEVAQTKREGLQDFYGISDARTVSFFTVHESVDQVHRQSEMKVLSDTCDTDEAQAEAVAAARAAAKALWDFLTGIQTAYVNPAPA